MALDDRLFVFEISSRKSALVFRGTVPLWDLRAQIRSCFSVIFSYCEMDPSRFGSYGSWRVTTLAEPDYPSFSYLHYPSLDDLAAEAAEYESTGVCHEID